MLFSVGDSVCVCVCARACVRACACMCVHDRACVRSCVKGVGQQAVTADFNVAPSKSRQGVIIGENTPFDPHQLTPYHPPHSIALA